MSDVVECNCCKFFEAVQKADNQYLSKAFELIESSKKEDCSSYEDYGETDCGAAVCYIIRLGSASDILKVFTITRVNETVRGHCIRALWWEYPHSIELWVHIFIHGTGEQRSEMLENVDISTSEGEDMTVLTQALKQVDLTSEEKRKLNLTITGKHYA